MLNRCLPARNRWRLQGSRLLCPQWRGDGGAGQSTLHPHLHAQEDTQRPLHLCIPAGLGGAQGPSEQLETTHRAVKMHPVFLVLHTSPGSGLPGVSGNEWQSALHPKCKLPSSTSTYQG